MLIGTWRTTRENIGTTRVEWDTLGQVIRKTREGSPYLKGESGDASMQSIGRFSGQTDWYSGRGTPMLPSS
jgi:YD repeat-containing protein